MCMDGSVDGVSMLPKLKIDSIHGFLKLYIYEVKTTTPAAAYYHASGLKKMFD